jgi:enoyl-CoA hydratase/carnithine racemase
MDFSVSMDKHFEPLEKMINSFINFPKLLIAIVNGPAIGIGKYLIIMIRRWKLKIRFLFLN